MKAITQFLTGVLSELRRVEWPKRTEVIRHTIYIIIAVIIAGLIVAVVDLIFTRLLELLLT